MKSYSQRGSAATKLSAAKQPAGGAQNYPENLRVARRFSGIEVQLQRRAFWLFLVATLARFSSVEAQDHLGGLLPPTPEERAWFQENVREIKEVVPNAVSALRTWLAAQEQGSFSTRPSPLDNPSLPPSVDNSAADPVTHKIYLPAVGRQQFNDCVCWAIGYYYKTFQEARDANLEPVANDRIMSPSFMFNIMNGGRNAGLSLFGGMEFLLKFGASSLADMPYVSFTDWPSETAWRNGSHNRADAWGYIDANDDFGIRNLKQHLANGDLAVTELEIWDNIGGYLGPEFGGLSNTLIDHYQGSKYGDHAVAIVGFDDSVVSQDNGHVGAFKLVNSWGPGWGVKGFFWLSYEFFKHKGETEAYVMADRIGYTPRLLYTIGVNHPLRDNLIFSAGAGETASPLGIVELLRVAGGDFAIDDGSRLVFDLTDLLAVIPRGAPVQFFVELLDSMVDSQTGDCTSMEVSFDGDSIASQDVPQSTVNGKDIYMAVTRTLAPDGTGINHAPVLSILPEGSAIAKNEGDQIDFVVAATDEDNDIVRLWCDYLPEGATYDENTGQFHWPTGFSDTGSRLLIFHASDGVKQDSLLVNIFIANVNRPPLARINIQTAPPYSVPQRIDLDGSASTDPDPDDDLSFSWNFGDGASGSGEVISHTYDTAGSYTIVLTVADQSGGTGLEQAVISIPSEVNQPPTAELLVNPTAGIAPLLVSADASGSSDADGTLTLFEHDFDFDGKTFEPQKTGVTASWTYSAAGVYVIALRVTDDDRATAMVTATVTVEEGCADGTGKGECSATKPLYCDAGLLKQNCARCGCDAGVDCLPDGQCGAGCHDWDGDGYGVPASSSCAQATADCNDTNAEINPGVLETCNGLDDDCDLQADEGFDLAADPENCGLCGSVCAPPATCVAGRCVEDGRDPGIEGGCACSSEPQTAGPLILFWLLLTIARWLVPRTPLPLRSGWALRSRPGRD